MNERNEELIALQRKIAAYRTVQHDTTRQLYGVTSALLTGEPRQLDSVLRQLSNFGYELDRLQLVEKDKAELMTEVRKDYDQFIALVSRAIDLARSGQVDAARELQSTQARRLADQLERRTNELVNVATANMLDRIETGKTTYETSRSALIWVALGSVGLALLLGYTFSASILGPLAQISTRLGEIAGGRFEGVIKVPNRDELGALAGDINRTSEKLGNLYQQIEERTAALQRSVGELKALGEISEAINSSLDVDTVLDSIVAHATTLAEASGGALYSFDDAEGLFRLGASHELDPAIERRLRDQPLSLGEGAVGRAGAARRPVQVADIENDADHALRVQMLAAGYRSILAVPLLREGALLGGLVLLRKERGAFAAATETLLATLANQSVLAVNNARLFREIEEKSQAARRGQPAQIGVPRQYEPRASHADERDPRLRRADPDGIYGEVPAHDPGRAWADQTPTAGTCWR